MPRRVKELTRAPGKASSPPRQANVSGHTVSQSLKRPRIRVLCVDDHRIVREGIGLIIGRQPDMEVVGSAATGEEAVQLFVRERPDITLMDLQLGTMSGLQAIQLIRRKQPDARIIVLTMYRGDEDVHRALKAGATTYLLKDTLSDDLIRIVREVHAGERPLGAQVKARLEERASHPTLTRREIEVLEHVSRGMRNREIASLLKISEDTVTVHMRNIFAKLGVGERISAVNVAIRRGIVHHD
jgi:DNA-binding NarL/FixJ family response regulator